MHIFLFLLFLKSLLLVFLVVIIIQQGLGNSSKPAFSLSLVQQSNKEQPLKILVLLHSDAAREIQHHPSNRDSALQPIPCRAASPKQWL